MDAATMLQNDLQKERDKVRAILDNADAAGRGVTAEEREQTEASMARMTELKSRIQDERDKDALRGLVDGFERLHNGQSDSNPVREPAVASKARSLGDALVASDSFRMWQAATKDNGKAPKFSTSPVFVPESRFRQKAAGDPVLESDNAGVFAGGPGPLTTFLGLETPGFIQYRLTVEDLLTTVPVTTGNSITYPVVKTRTRISGTPQTEGAAKPGGEYEFDMKTKVLLTMAGWVKLSTQFIEDAPSLVAYINADLPLQIRQNVEAYLVDQLYDDAQNTGIGGGGVVAGAGINGSNGFDAILEAMTIIQENGGNPDGMIITPTDWAGLLVTKNDGGNEAYTGGGPFTPTGNPWGLRVVVTPSAVAGEPLVGDFARGAKIYSRGGYSVDSTNTDQDDFIKNKFTVRAERRLVEGTTYPEFFVVAQTGTS